MKKYFKSLLLVFLSSIAIRCSGGLNNSPNSPIITDIPSSAKINETIMVIVVASDPDGDRVACMVDWGDGSDLAWGSFVANETGISVTHTYAKEGSYSIRVKAKDDKGAESDWSLIKTINVTSGSNIIDIEWCEVQAGLFGMGNNNEFDDEKPEHNIYLDSYYISKYEITYAQYCKFLNAISVSPQSGNTGVVYYNGNIICEIGYGNYWDQDILYDGSKFYVKSGYENYPMVLVTWHGAKAFCEYYGWRLPTEAEWEKASRGTDMRKYPWGNTEPDCSKAQYEMCGGYTVPVGTKTGVSPYGCYDMLGNVWEWCNDWYDENYYSVSPDNNPQGPSSGTNRVNRGGSWYSGSGFIRCSDRSGSPPSTRSNKIGFRPVKD